MLNWKLKLLKHRSKIEGAIQLIKAIADYGYTRSKLSLVSGGLLAITDLLDIDKFHPRSYFSKAEGWVSIFEREDFNNLFVSVFSKLDGRQFEFAEPTKLYKLDGVEFVVIYDIYGTNSPEILVQADNREKLQQIFVEKKMKELGNQILYLEQSKSDNAEWMINPLQIKEVKSKLSEQYIGSIQRAFDLGLTRSYLFYGPAGTGKTSLSQTLVRHFNLRTLKFNCSEYFSIPLVLLFIDLFKVEALILDDFDQVDIDVNLFSFLELAASKVKLMIGVANSLEDFHPALTRPQRFDCLCKIDRIDEETIQEVLGEELYGKFGARVKSFPISYLIELKKQSLLNPETLENEFVELNERVKKMLIECGADMKTAKKKKVKKTVMELLK
jgi:ATPase family associated with various cellular activities (AAA)